MRSTKPKHAVALPVRESIQWHLVRITYDELFRRSSPRLKGFDYARPGVYFITICTINKLRLFGMIRGGEMILHPFGQIAQQCWRNIPDHFLHVQLDEFIVMPDHLHGIIVLKERPQAVKELRTRECFAKPVPGSLPTIIRSYKSAVTYHINAFRKEHGIKVWQKRFFEHRIHDKIELNTVRKYIANNPRNWKSRRGRTRGPDLYNARRRT